MNKVLMGAVLLVVVLTACGGSAPDVETSNETITVYKPPT